MGLLDKLKRKQIDKTDQLSQLIQQQKYHEALTVLEGIFDNTKAKDWYTKAQILDKKQEQKKASECYIQATKLDDSLYDAWYKIGKTQFESGHFKSAARSFAKTPIIDKPIDYTEWNGISTFYYMMALYMYYLESHDKEIRQKVSEQIKKLKTIIDFKEDSEEKFLAFCSKNFKDILKILHPNNEVDFRAKSQE